MLSISIRFDTSFFSWKLQRMKKRKRLSDNQIIIEYWLCIWFHYNSEPKARKCSSVATLWFGTQCGKTQSRFHLAFRNPYASLDYGGVAVFHRCPFKHPDLWPQKLSLNVLWITEHLESCQRNGSVHISSTIARMHINCHRRESQEKRERKKTIGPLWCVVSICATCIEVE